MNFLKRNGSERPQTTALIFGDQQMSYQEPDEITARCAPALREHGIQKGDRVRGPPLIKPA